MKNLPMLTLPALALATSGCMTATRIALAVAPTAAIAVNERVAEHCVGAAQSGATVDQRRQVRADFAGIAYEMEIAQRTTTAQQAGVAAGRALRRSLCPPLPVFEGSVDLNAEPAAPVEPTP